MYKESILTNIVRVLLLRYINSFTNKRKYVCWVGKILILLSIFYEEGVLYELVFQMLKQHFLGYKGSLLLISFKSSLLKVERIVKQFEVVHLLYFLLLDLLLLPLKNFTVEFFTGIYSIFFLISFTCGGLFVQMLFLGKGSKILSECSHFLQFLIC